MAAEKLHFLSQKSHTYAFYSTAPTRERNLIEISSKIPDLTRCRQINRLKNYVKSMGNIINITPQTVMTDFRESILADILKTEKVFRQIIIYAKHFQVKICPLSCFWKKNLKIAEKRCQGRYRKLFTSDQIGRFRLHNRTGNVTIANFMMINYDLFEVSCVLC